MKKIIIIFFKIAISFFLLLFLFKKIDTENVFILLGSFNKFFIVVSFLLFCFAYFLGMVRWLMLLYISEVDFSIKKVVVTYLGSQFFSLFVPSIIGSDVARSIDLGKYSNSFKKVAVTVFLDRLSGSIGLVLVAFSSLLLGKSFINNFYVYLIIYVFVLAILIILTLLFNSRIFDFFSRVLQGRGRFWDKFFLIHKEIFYFRKHRFLLLLNIAISVVIQLVVPVIFWILTNSLYGGVSIFPFLIIVPIVTVISAIPITIGGLGVREWSMVLFLSQLGLDKSLSASLSLLQFVFLISVGVIGGIVYVLTFHTRRLQYNK
ncbi:MAG: lysylphosphatidylglycerol synthase transmembrane domain-containing protein [Candidatus Gygaella obscura]|nr:lysylphosphatidylglycerol synthase transmembrane domain-containing protein [Candidatus Gygaella obscura]